MIWRRSINAQKGIYKSGQAYLLNTLELNTYLFTVKLDVAGQYVASLLNSKCDWIVIKECLSIAP